MGARRTVWRAAVSGVSNAVSLPEPSAARYASGLLATDQRNSLVALVNITFRITARWAAVCGFNPVFPGLRWPVVLEGGGGT